MSDELAKVTPDPIVPVEPETRDGWIYIHMRVRPEMAEKVDFIAQAMRRDPDRIIETIGRTDACRKAIVEYARTLGWRPESESTEGA